MVMALLFTDDSLVPFLEEYLHISYLAVLAVPHYLSQQILTSEVKTSHLLTSHSQFQGLGCCLKPQWLIEADKIRREYVFSRESRMAGWRSVGIKTSSGSAEEASAARAGLINMLLIRGSRGGPAAALGLRQDCQQRRWLWWALWWDELSTKTGEQAAATQEGF